MTKKSDKTENPSPEKAVPKTTFETLRAINVNDHTEKKGNLTYLSWSWAWDQFKLAMPDAVYQIRDFDGKPYLHDPLTGYMVFTEVTAQGETHKMWLPVMDHSNRAMKQPVMTDINKSIMRCLTKNLAMFGLGLYIYAGEDLPEGDEDKKNNPDPALKSQKQASAKDAKAEKPAEPQKPANAMPDDEYEKHRVAIAEAGDLNSLKTAFTAACDKAREHGDGPAAHGFIKVKDDRKAELDKAAREAA